MKFDKIGYWSEVKHEIIKSYAAEYARIMNAQKNKGFSYYYIDAFSGPGKCISKETGEILYGSPLHALQIDPKFDHYYFIDLDGDKIRILREYSIDRNDVGCFQGDCNSLLIDKIFPRINWDDYQRALCVLDPYGLHLDWNVIETAGKKRCFDIFINFPIMDANRNVIWTNPDAVNELQRERLHRFWGDDSWLEIAYTDNQLDFFGKKEKVSNDVIAEAFRKRLREVASFKEVTKPIPMRNTRNAIVYYLYFASHKIVAKNIINYIFDKYRDF